jgi:hypothetical protein
LKTTGLEKSWSLDISQPSGPPRPFTALTFRFFLHDDAINISETTVNWKETEFLHT